MRISDWSSDVCSSDLFAAPVGGVAAMEDEMGENRAVTAHRRPLGVGRETARADGADREADVAAGEASLHPQLTLRSGLPERLGERRRNRDGLCHGWSFRRIMAFEQLRTIPRPVTRQ